MEKIYKSFGANNVLTDVEFKLGTGEICALLGENGAGKSTLMNILGGVLPADSGRIIIDGEEKKFSNPVDSLDAGIGFIHQELNLINDLSIYENMFITHLPKKGAFLDAKLMQQKTAELFERMNIQLDPTTMVRDLGASYKQIVEICRALMQEASIIIMDEPTTSLTEPEIERVFEMTDAPILKVRSMQEIKDECFGPKKTKFSLRLLCIFLVSVVVSIPVGIFLHNSQYHVESQFGFSWLVATLIFFGMWFGISLLIDLFEHHSRVYIKR